MWNFYLNTEVCFGSNTILGGDVSVLNEKLKEMKIEKALLVIDPIFVSNQICDLLTKTIDAKTVVFSQVTPNPTLDEVTLATNLAKENDCQAVVGFGGGSSLDIAKVVASHFFATNELEEYFYGKSKYSEKCLPLILVPTTSGTGSEVTFVSVLTNTKTHEKIPMGHKNFSAKYAIVDPTLTTSMPKTVTANSGMDVLSHSLEAFYSINHQPTTDALALHSAGLVFDFLERAYADGNDLEAREKMSEASVVAGLAFALPKTAGAHACSYPLTTVYKMPHGEACSFTQSEFVRINAKVENGRLNTFAKKLGFKDAYAMADKIDQMKKTFGMKMTCKQANIEQKDLKELSKLCQHPNLTLNPVKMNEQDVYEMFMRIYD